MNTMTVTEGFMKDSVKRFTDYFYLVHNDGSKTLVMNFKPTKNFAEQVGFPNTPKDPCDDFEPYTDFEFCVDGDKLTLMYGDNFDSKEFEVVGSGKDKIINAINEKVASLSA